MSAGRAPIARGSSSTKVVEIVGFARLCPIELERLEGKAGMLIRLSRSSPRDARSARRKQPPLSTSERLVERVLAAVEEDLRRARSFEGKDTDRGAVFVGEVGSGESRANTTLFIPLSEREGYFPSDSASSTSVASASCSLSSPPSTFRGLGEYGRIELETPFSIDNSSKALIPSATSISAIICDASHNLSTRLETHRPPHGSPEEVDLSDADNCSAASTVFFGPAWKGSRSGYVENLCHAVSRGTKRDKR